MNDYTGTVRIDVRWPKEAMRDDWRIKEVVAIDEHGIAHMVEIVGTSRGSSPSKSPMAGEISTVDVFSIHTARLAPLMSAST